MPASHASTAGPRPPDPALAPPRHAPPATQAAVRPDPRTPTSRPLTASAARAGLFSPPRVGGPRLPGDDGGTIGRCACRPALPRPVPARRPCAGGPRDPRARRRLRAPDGRPGRDDPAVGRRGARPARPGACRGPPLPARRGRDRRRTGRGPRQQGARAWRRCRPRRARRARRHARLAVGRLRRPASRRGAARAPAPRTAGPRARS
jgi:hypothetical protein